MPGDAGAACAEVPAPDPEPLGRFQLRHYWVAHERHFPDGATTVLCDADQAMITLVTEPFAGACRRQGTCQLNDGRLLNAWQPCDCPGGMCYARLDPRRYPWGKGTGGRPLRPFRSVAVDPAVIAPGTRLYLPELRGLPLPSGGVHDGCVDADDVGGGIRGRELDLFLGQRVWGKRVRRRLPVEVTVYVDPPQCRGAI